MAAPLKSDTPTTTPTTTIPDEHIATARSRLPSKKRPRQPGRPTLLTRDRHDKIVGLIRQGVHPETAAVASGISDKTIYAWIARGDWDAEQIDNGELFTKDGVLVESTVFSEFAQAVREAERSLEAELTLKWKRITTSPTTKTTRVHKEKVIDDPSSENGYRVVRYLDKEQVDETGDGDWRGIDNLLGKRFPERWMDKKGVELTGSGGGPVQVAVDEGVANVPLSIRKLFVLLVDRPGVAVPSSLMREIEEFVAVETARVVGSGGSGSGNGSDSGSGSGSGNSIDGNVNGGNSYSNSKVTLSVVPSWGIGDNRDDE